MCDGSHVWQFRIALLFCVLVFLVDSSADDNGLHSKFVIAGGASSRVTRDVSVRGPDQIADNVRLRESNLKTSDSDRLSVLALRIIDDQMLRSLGRLGWLG